MLRKISFFISFVLMFCKSLSAQSNNASIVQRTDTLINAAYKQGIFSGMIALLHNGKEIYYKAFGYADWQNKKEFTRNTLFNIGSLNKQFTEEMIHQLVHEKKLSYSDKLNAILNLFPNEQGAKISIQMLLNMQSGLGDYLQAKAFKELSEQDFTLNQLIDLIKAEPLLYEPGTSERYSNSGYAVLGAVIEKITGKSYEENLTERIAKPLKLKLLLYKKESILQQDAAASGTILDMEGNKINKDHIINATPAGGIYCSINDLIAFTEAKRKNELPSTKIYGNGTFAGGTPFWNSIISYNSATEYTFVIMANMSEIADKLAPRIKAILNNEPITPIPLPFTITLNKLLNEKGIAYVKLNIQSLAQEAQLPYDDRFLNYFGYQILKAGKTENAIALFLANTELFPSDANTFDSLAEAYLLTGDKENALKNYKRSLQLNPLNENAKENINRLDNQK